MAQRRLRLATAVEVGVQYSLTISWQVCSGRPVRLSDLCHTDDIADWVMKKRRCTPFPATAFGACINAPMTNVVSTVILDDQLQGVQRDDETMADDE